MTQTITRVRRKAPLSSEKWQWKNTQHLAVMKNPREGKDQGNHHFLSRQILCCIS